jgi:dihydropteroate synthase
MPRYLLVTGKIAYQALDRVARSLNLEGGYTIKVLKRPVAALMTTGYIARNLQQVKGETGAEVVVIPGLCQGPLELITGVTGCQVVRGPADLKDLPAFFGSPGLPGDLAAEESEGDLPRPKPKIIAEIVDAPRLTVDQIIARARYYRASGADIIDIGCDVHRPFPHLAETVRVLKEEGFEVSVDSHRPEEIRAANLAGVDLVLSLNSSNLELAKELQCPAVVVPDEGEGLSSLERNIEKLERWGKPYILDPILPPLTLGLAEGISRYCLLRQKFPRQPLLMGIGNVTELIDADSTGLNALLVGLAVELDIDYVLTTEVSHRAVGAVKEVCRARRLVQRALARGSLPKHLDYSLLTIKEPRGNSFSEAELREMHTQVRDKNYRIFVDDHYIYVFNNHIFQRGTSAQELFARLAVSDPGHAFYLGRELEKAELALRLRKKYVQDRPLRWGYLGEDAGQYWLEENKHFVRPGAGNGVTGEEG